jgi:hypothetical protein
VPRTVDAGHREAAVGDHGVVGVGDDPGGCRVTTAVLAGVATQPLGEDRLA